MTNDRTSDRIKPGGSDALTLEEQTAILEDMTSEQVHRGLYPRTFDDLKYRASAFSRIDTEALNNPPNKQKAKK